MLLVPKAQGLVEMLQTIYETESCLSADGMSGREPSLEILPRTPLHSIPVAGKWLLCPHLPSALGHPWTWFEHLTVNLASFSL